MMNNIFLQTINRIISIECDNNPNDILKNIWDVTKLKLPDHGFAVEALNNVSFDHLIKPNFTHKLIINPDYLANRINGKSFFFFIKSKSKDYLNLTNEVKIKFPNLSFFVCYGQFDVILHSVGDESMVENISLWIDSKDFHHSILCVDKTILFFDKIITKRRDFSDIRIPYEKIDEYFSSNFDKIDPNIANDLIELGVALGPTYIEETHETGRIRAIIIVRLDNRLYKSDINKFENELLKFNSGEFLKSKSRPLSSIYKCNEGYLLEFIFEDQAQLDRVTDDIQNITSYIDNTETIIIAKANYFLVTKAIR